MDKLPLELKHEICSYLTPKDLKGVRLQNNDLAATGACYILPRVFVFNCEKSVAELTEIAGHPIFSKHVKTLIYDPSWLRNTKVFNVWNERRAESCYMPRWDDDFEVHQSTGADGKPDRRSLRAMQRYQRAKEDYDQACSQSPIAPALIDAAWARYRAHVSTQSSDAFLRSLVATIASALSSCPKIDNIMIGADEYSFKSPRNRLYPDMYISDQLWTRGFCISAATKHAEAFAGLTIDLRHLTVMQAEGSVLEALINSNRLGLSLRNIKSLRYSGASRYYLPGERNHVTPQLSDLAHIEVLKLCGSWSQRFAILRLDRLLQGAHWKSLHTIHFVWCSMSSDILVKFLLRHSATLKRLAFKKCELESGSWKSVFTQLSGRLPRLERAVWEAELYAGYQKEYYIWPMSDSTVSFANALQDYIIKGGIMPDESQPYRYAQVAPTDTSQPDSQAESDEIDQAFW